MNLSNSLVIYCQIRYPKVWRIHEQKFAGSLLGTLTRKDIMIPISRFTDDTWKYMEVLDKEIALNDSKILVDLMIKHNMGVTEDSL